MTLILWPDGKIEKAKTIQGGGTKEGRKGGKRV